MHSEGLRTIITSAWRSLMEAESGTKRKAGRASHRGSDFVLLIGAGSLWGLPPRAPTDPDVHVKRIRFVAMWNRCPSHDWVVSR